LKDTMETGKAKTAQLDKPAALDLSRRSGRTNREKAPVKFTRKYR